MILLAALAATALSAETPEGILKQADQLETDGRIARAAELYKSFLKSYPDHTQALEAHYRLAKCLDNLGLVDEAIQHLDVVAQSKDKRYKHRLDAFYLLGKLHGSLKHHEAAARTFEQMLAEGAGLYEDEALSLCGGHYAILRKHDEAAARFNILKQREGSRFAEQAAYKLAVMWLKAEDLERAVAAVEDLAARFPANKDARGLMLQIADLFRRQRKFPQAIAACEQLKTRFPRSREAEEAGYVLGLCHRDRKQFDKAIETLDAVARVPAHRTSGLAAEALLQTGDICTSDLTQPEKAMPRYEEAIKLARESNSERRDQILEQCYFRLAEYHYTQKKWSVALEYYVLLRRLGSKVNVLPRILKCQAELKTDASAGVGTEADLEAIRKKVEENPGTAAAAEGEVFLADRALARALESKSDLGAAIEQYEGVLKKYPKEVLSQQSLESYVCLQLGICYAQGETKGELKKAVATLEKALAVNPETPYKTEILENIARVADATGDKQKSLEVYQRLFAASAQKVEGGQADDAERQRMSQYLRAILSRAEQKDSIEEALRLAHEITQKSGPFSEAARHAMFYMGELYYLKKDYANAAKTFKGFIKVYGPKLDEKGDVANPPWRPADISEQVEQVYEAAVRVAHAWRMQGHFANMVKAYEWLVANLNYKNKHVAEAQYWLALELIKGRKGEERENRLKAAEALWKNVVHPSFEFEDRDFRKRFHFWVDDPDAEEYVKAAILKSGQFLSELGEHERAAGIFNQHLELYPEVSRKGRRRVAAEPDPMCRIARYALGREHIALGNIPKLIECYKVYLDQMRDDKFRVSALQLLGYHAAQQGAFDQAIEGYATLLDEYGDNERNAKGESIPVPPKERIRRGGYHWDGIRLEPPKGLDLGEVRFALGFLYWKKESWADCAKILAPFVENPQLFNNKARPKALYMAAQSYYHDHDYERGLQVILKLLRDHPQFEAADEAHVYAARGYAETGKWSEIPPLYQAFVKERPQSPNRPHMDLYAALSALHSANPDSGVSRLKGIANSDTYQDVKADACYHLGLHLLSEKPPQHRAALEYLGKSVDFYPRERSCLAAARCCIELKDWEKAKALLQRTLRDFPTGNRRMIEEAKQLLPDVLKHAAKQN